METKTILLKNTSFDGENLTATFLPDLGLNLISYQKGKVEMIDPNTKEEFENRFSGLGPIIGPHFHHQKDSWVAKGFDESLFPHIERIRKKKQKDPFSHGIARYVPWNVEFTETTIKAHISGSDTYKSVPLKDFEGTDFHMTFDCTLTPDGLHIEMSVESDRVCLCGLHYYYALEDHQGMVTASIQDTYNDMGVFKPLPKKWKNKETNLFTFNLQDSADYGFLPDTEDFSGWVLLETNQKKLKVSYQGKNEQTSWQLYSPKDASFACIEPMCAKNPRRLTEKSGKLKVQIEIL